MSEEKNKPGDPIRYGDCIDAVNRFKKDCPGQPHTYSMPISAIKALVERGESLGAENVTIDMCMDSYGKNGILYGLTKGRKRISATNPKGEATTSSSEKWENNTFLNFTGSCPPPDPILCPCPPDDPNCGG
ncbi:MAG: hypothetical protein VYB44_07230 [Bacteroidota bacterium]|nr:hypothetical protein [Bacteroidota bacterium]